MFAEFMPYVVKDNTILLKIKVSPGASKNKIGKIENDADNKPFLKIYISTPPVDGKANKYLVKFLADNLNISASKIKIISGLTSKIKTIQIEDIAENKVKAFLNDSLN
ncbi:MAG: DUF167 domain-containing protein [Alphaproteobacteria bacterium]|nr:DUF167 domain-containing protein [Alphaproteobacteria bacterium]OJV15362.1 MAG: hypothetical protein BGO27_02520 [Alphaproteobacteria bacterium 33-17]